MREDARHHSGTRGCRERTLRTAIKIGAAEGGGSMPPTEGHEKKARKEPAIGDSLLFALPVSSTGWLR